MKNQIAFITVGQAGGNIGSLFEKDGFEVLNFNTAPQDLATLTHAKHKYHIKGGEGCSRDRDMAKHLAKNDLEAMLEKVKQTLPQEYIFVIFSLGGGTGSGTSPMLIELIIHGLNKKVGAITVMPSNGEQIRTLVNAFECFKELESIDGMCATFVLDNNRAISDKFALNNAFFELFLSFLEIPTHHNAKGNIDTAEIKEMLSTPGAAIISKLAKTANNTSGLIQSFRENIFAPPEDDAKIKYLGISSNININIESVIKETGTCLEVFSGVNPDSTICMFCGLTFPYTVLENFRVNVEKNKDAITNIFKKETRLGAGIDLLQGVSSTGAKSATVEKSDIEDILSKFMKK